VELCGIICGIYLMKVNCNMCGNQSGNVNT